MSGFGSALRTPGGGPASISRRSSTRRRSAAQRQGSFSFPQSPLSVRVHSLKIFRISRNFQTTKAWMEASEFMVWVEPSAGCVCFPRIKESIPLDLDRFYALLLDKYKTFVGPGHWFEMDRRYMRIGYGWPTNEGLRDGLESINRAIREALSKK